MKILFTINLLLFSLSFFVLPQSVEEDFPKSLFLDMQLVSGQRKQTHLKNELHAELLNYSFSLPDTIITIKEKKLICFKNTTYYEFEAIINDTSCLYLMVNKNGKYSLLEGTPEDDGYLFRKIGFPILSTEEQIFEYLTLYIDLLCTRKREIYSSKFRMIDIVKDEIITKVKDANIESLTAPKLIGEINNKYRVQVYLSFDGAIYKAVYTLSKEGEVSLVDDDVSLVAHYNYRERFENGKIVKYDEFNFYQPAAIKLENVFKKDVQFTQLNYKNNEIEFFMLSDTLIFTLIDFSKLDWQEATNKTISRKYMAEFHFKIADSLRVNESFVFFSIDIDKWELLSPTNRTIKSSFPTIKVDKNKYSIHLGNRLEIGEYSVRIYSNIKSNLPIYIAISSFSASDSDANQLLRALFELQNN